jgi:hypothetical protein
MYGIVSSSCIVIGRPQLLQANAARQMVLLILPQSFPSVSFLINCFLLHNFMVYSLQLLVALLNKLQISGYSGIYVYNAVLHQKGANRQGKI